MYNFKPVSNPQQLSWIIAPSTIYFTNFSTQITVNLKIKKIYQKDPDLDIK